MNLQVKLISNIFYFSSLTIFLAIIYIVYHLDAFLESIPTIFFFGFWVLQTSQHTKDLENKLVKLKCECQIEDIPRIEFWKSYFVEVAVVAAANYLIMAFKYPNPPIEQISIFTMIIIVGIGYASTKRETMKGYIPLCAIISASLIAGQCVYIVDNHHNSVLLFFSTLISSIVIDTIYLVKQYVIKN